MRVRLVSSLALTLYVSLLCAAARADVVPPSCGGTDPAVQACSGKQAADACTFTNGTRGNCAALRCTTDGGATVLSCVATGASTGGGCSIALPGAAAASTAGPFGLASALAATAALLSRRSRRGSGRRQLP